MSDPGDYEGSLLTITAEIVSLDPEGFIIKIHNDETDETLEARSAREYAEYLIQSVRESSRDNFVARWLPSPLARRSDIDLIGMQLAMMNEWMQENLAQKEAGLGETIGPERPQT